MLTNFRRSISILMFATLCMIATSLCGQGPENKPATQIAAKVGNHDIQVATVNRFLEKRIGSQNQSFTDDDLIKAHALEHLVRRAIVRDFLVSKKRWAGENAIRLDIEQFEAQLKRADLSLADHLKKNNISREQFDFETAWRLSWDTYLNRVLSDKVLASYFERNRIKFDGTTMKVAHLLLNDDSMSDQECRETLQQIKTKVDAQPLEWSNLVAQHSQATSKDSAGEVGWIGIEGPMPPDFTNAAFQLKVGQTSPPVKTRIGWHLIKCVEIKPGKKGPQDARQQVIESAKQELFFKIARDHRNKVKIEYSGAWPHLDESGVLAK